MGKYRITYRYTMEGYQTIEAETRKKAREKHLEEEYGDSETVISHTIRKIERIKE